MKKKTATRKYKLLPDEPYEMTYWKEKLQSPLHRFATALRHFFSKRTYHRA